MEYYNREYIVRSNIMRFRFAQIASSRAIHYFANKL